MKHIVTTCPHAYNTFKNEYPSLGGKYKVQHHSEYIFELLKSNKIKVNKNLEGQKVTYHDPCYLGRANDVYDPPRELIRSLGVDFVEMKRNKRRSFVVEPAGRKCLRRQKKAQMKLILLGHKKQ